MWLWQQEADATLRKARALKNQRREEYQKAQSAASRSQEDQSNAGNKQLEKKRKLEEEALQKVGGRNENRKNNWCQYFVALFGMDSNFSVRISSLSLCYSLSIVLGRRRRPRASTRTA